MEERRSKRVREVLEAIEEGDNTFVTFVWYAEPWTFVVIRPNYSEVVGFGSALLGHGDTWDISTGKQIATKRAVRNLIDNIATRSKYFIGEKVNGG